jgi:heat shock protein HtpX
MKRKPPSLFGRALLAVVLTVGFYGLALFLAGLLLLAVYGEVAVAHRVSAQFTVFCLVGAVAIIWAIFPRIDRFQAPGPRLEPDEHPRLFRELERLAEQTGQAMPAEVYMVAEVNAAVTQRGGAMGISSRRVMILGLPLLQVLTLPQLRAVLAHEFGHFWGGDTRLGPWIYQTRSAIARTTQNLSRSWLVAPFMAYANMFLRVTYAISRRQEFVADELAARTVGAEVLAEGLRTVSGAAAAFQGYLRSEYLPALGAGFQPPLVEGFQRFVQAEPVTRAMQELVETEAASQEADPYETHPTLGERLAALARYTALAAGDLSAPTQGSSRGRPAGAAFAFETGLAGPAALPSRTAEAADNTPAIALLEDVPRLENLLLAHLLGQQPSQQLQPLAWDELGAAVLLPNQEQFLRSYAPALDGIAAAGLPAALHTPPEALIARIAQSAGRILSPSEMRQAVQSVFVCALTVSLAHRGWMLDTAPGLPITMRQGARTITPALVVAELASEQLQPQCWRELCQATSITDLRLDGG